jgi:DNA-binding FadR family transcriptional regulator
MDIYGAGEEIRLDERQLSQDLGVSRTPIREALTVLEQEGFVRSVPRRGIFVIRKSKREIIELIQVWAALESMAARLAAERASDAELADLGRIFSEFETEEPGRAHARILRGEYPLPSDRHSAERLRADPGDDGEPVPAHAGDQGRIGPAGEPGGAVQGGPSPHH